MFLFCLCFFAFCFFCFCPAIEKLITVHMHVILPCDIPLFAFCLYRNYFFLLPLVLLIYDSLYFISQISNHLFYIPSIWALMNFDVLYIIFSVIDMFFTFMYLTRKTIKIYNSKIKEKCKHKAKLITVKY